MGTGKACPLSTQSRGGAPLGLLSILILIKNVILILAGIGKLVLISLGIHLATKRLELIALEKERQASKSEEKCAFELRKLRSQKKK